MTPGTFEATNSASSRWNCQLAVPVSVTKPSAMSASTVAGTRVFSVSAWRMSPRRSASARLSSFMICTSRSLLTCLTPWMRSASFFASCFSRKLPTVPRSVTTPSSAEAVIALLLTFGSQMSSSVTERCSSSFDMFELLFLCGVVDAAGRAGRDRRRAPLSCG
jgi:hypothetical protein